MNYSNNETVRLNDSPIKTFLVIKYLESLIPLALVYRLGLEYSCTVQSID